MKNNTRLKNFFISIIVILVIITILASTVLSSGIINRCEDYMLTETSSLLASNAAQLKLNINYHMSEIEGSVALMFADDEVINYDSSTSTLDEYDQINIENHIAERIVDLGAIENYSDFCVVYANDNTVGWKSKTTQNMYADGGIYDDVSSFISDNKTLDGWKFGVQDNFDRMYYAKRCNDNAVILTSFYTRELEHTFEYPDGLDKMTVRLVDDSGHIVYSSDDNEIGQLLNDNELSYIEKGVDVSAVTATQLINTSICKNGWVVMCLISRDSIMKTFHDLRNFAHILSIVISILAIIVTSITFRYLIKPVGGYVEDLSERATIDKLSGTMARRAFEDAATANLTKNIYPESAFIMFDIDNFKQINDTFGHDYGDEVISRMGALLNRMLIETDDMKPIIGRLGGDEFAAYVGFTQSNQLDIICKLLDKVLAEFLIEYAKEREQIALSISAGLAMSSAVSVADYHNMYMAADSALYISKESGKNRYNVFKEGLGK